MGGTQQAVGADPRVHARPVAAGGWRRAVTGVAVGLAVGLVAALALPRA